MWRTDDAGRTWPPIFDQVNVGSIGAIAVAPSSPKTIYVGTGEADMRSDIAQGIGMFRSSRWRRDMAGDRASGHAADRQDPGRSAQSECASRRRARPSLRPERRARRVPLDRRRADTGPKPCSRTPTPAPSTWRSNRAIRTSSMPRCGRRGGRRGTPIRRRTVRAAASTNRLMAAGPGIG